MKRNFTRVKLKSSDVEILVMSGNQLHETGLIESRHYAVQRVGDGSWSLTLDVLQEFHPLSKDDLYKIEFARVKTGVGYECKDFEIAVIEYQNSKNPVIRKFDDSCLKNYHRKMEDGMRNEIALAREGDIDAGNRIFEHVASINIIDDQYSQAKIIAFLGVMRMVGMIPQGHLVDSLRERFAHAKKILESNDDMNAMQSWFDAVCLKARSMLIPASTAPRRAATI